MASSCEAFITRLLSTRSSFCSEVKNLRHQAGAKLLEPKVSFGEVNLGVKGDARGFKVDLLCGITYLGTTRAACSIRPSADDAVSTASRDPSFDSRLSLSVSTSIGDV